MTPQEYRDARMSAGLSQQALARALGVDREIVNRREAGKAPIRLEAVLALSIVVEQAKRAAPVNPPPLVPETLTPQL